MTSITQTHSNTIDFHHDIASSIPGLLDICRPSAITRLVVTVIIDSFNRMTRIWLQSHVSKKRFEVVPLFTHSYSSTTISRIFRSVRILATSNHGLPASPLCRWWFMERTVTMLFFSSWIFSGKTSAALSAFCNEAGSADDFLLSAVTSTQPHRRTTGVIRGPGDNSEARKSLSSSISKV
jgi:hypothetical protein